MKRAPRFPTGGLLEIETDRQGIVIRGNRLGLSALAKMVVFVGKRPNPRFNFHEHLAFKWIDAMQRGNLILRIQGRRLRAPTKTRPGSAEDVTIMRTVYIGRKYQQQIRREVREWKRRQRQ